MSQDPSNFLEAAAAIGNALCRDALWWGGRCTWLGDDMTGDEEGTIVHRTVGSYLYDGTAGIALFLARLAALTGDRLHAETAKGAVAQALEECAAAGGPRLKGFFCGRSGVAYAATVVGECLGDAELQESGLVLLRGVALEGADGWEDTDVMYGTAGAAVAALRVSSKYAEPGLLAWACELGRRLLLNAEKEEFGWSWPANPDELGMNGFSHGAAGIAWVLGELARASGEEEFFRAASEATRYERHWFDPEVSNWQDLFPEFVNDPSRPPEFSVSWCHGAPGIALSRLRLWELFREPAHEQEARTALLTTSEDLRAAIDGSDKNFSLCHGVAGNAEALIVASRILGDESFMKAAREVGAMGVERYAASEEGWPCGVYNTETWSPSLMLGWAGTGYFYLRLHDPSRTPSVLLLGC